MDETNYDNEKTIKFITDKLKDGEIILLLENVSLFGRSNSQNAKLVISSSSLYFLQGFNIKKYFKATSIECVVVTPFSNEMVIFYNQKTEQSSKETIRIESNSNVRIVQHIITVREKFNDMKAKLMVMVSSNRYLDTIASVGENLGRNKVFGFLFKKKEGNIDLQERFSGEGEIIHVGLSDFAIEVGQKMYNQIEQNVKLLYINSTETFRFEEEKYDMEEIGESKKLFVPYRSSNKKQSSSSKIISSPNLRYVLMRTIKKTENSSNKKITEYLSNYKNEEYKEELLYVLEKVAHYEIFTAQHQNENTCQEYLMEHDFLSEKDLRSILFKLIEMIENTHEIFCSIQPDNVIIGKQGVIISEIFSVLPYRTEIDYLAPEEFERENFSQNEIELINLWKLGILLFELGYGNVPFPAEHIAKSVKTKIDPELNFPEYSLRTQEFQTFIKSILRMDPKERGKPWSDFEVKSESNINWRESLMKSAWLLYK